MERAIDGELLELEIANIANKLAKSDAQKALMGRVMYCVEHMPTLAQPPITGDTSDGYHTFNELYHHRAVLFSVICNARPDITWKSKRHHDGTMYDDMFIVGIDTPDGQATYHYDIDPYWGLFRVKELEYAPEWDGHTPDEAIRRIGTLTPPNEPRMINADKLAKRIAGHSNYHGNSILAAIYCAAEGKENDAPIRPIETPPNEALTWNELGNMVGKPVYIVEMEDGESYWVLVHTVDDIKALFVSAFDQYDYGTRELYGQTWLAYRRPPEVSP